MITINKGIENEFEFAYYLNGKYVKELNPMFSNFIEAIFTNLKPNSKVKCWKNSKPQKTDIFIKIGIQIKRVSLKSGFKNSVHVERITDFINFLIENKMDINIIKSYLEYHYADGTRNGKGKNRLSSLEYQNSHPNELKKLNEAFNNEKFIINAIDRFVIKGKNSFFRIDAIISGTVEDFIWITKEEILKIHIKHKNIQTKGLHIGGLFVQPQDRCLNYNSKYNSKRFCVQLKWYHLSDDIIESMNDNIKNE